MELEDIIGTHDELLTQKKLNYKKLIRISRRYTQRYT